MSNYLNSSRWIGSDKASTKKRSVDLRLSKLHNDAVCEKFAAYAAKYSNKKNQKKAIEKVKWRVEKSHFSKYLEGRVKFHLGRGRDIGDIAIREKVMVSMVQAAVDRIKAQAAATNTATP